MAKSEFVGVDSCPYGWFSVGFSNSDTAPPELKTFPSFGKLLEHYAVAQLILVDIPIGLPKSTYGRDLDWKAKDLLGPRRRTVFLTPTRIAVEYLAHNPCYSGVASAVHHELTEAVQCKLDKAVQPKIVETAQRAITKSLRHEITKALQLEITGKSLSIQTLSIIPKIAEVDALLPRETAPFIREIHPEICFWALGGKKPMQHGKDTQDGRSERIKVLQGVECRAQNIFDDACKKFPKRKDVAMDDILDALVAAVTAREGSRSELHTLPENPPRDEKCLPMEMVYWRP